MKKIIFSIIIIFLIFLTSIIKNSTKKVDNNELVLLDHNFLSSPKKLNEYQKKYFENDLMPTDIVNIGEIDFVNGEILIKKSGEVFEK